MVLIRHQEFHHEDVSGRVISGYNDLMEGKFRVNFISRIVFLPRCEGL